MTSRMKCWGRGLNWCLFGAVTFLSEATAFGQATTTAAQQRLLDQRSQVSGINLAKGHGLHLGGEGYSGIGVLFMDGKHRGNAFYGAQLRLKYSYFELGGALEKSDYSEVEWSQALGYVGASLPFTNWVTVEMDVGLGLRRYHSKDLRYSESGATVSLPSLLARLGISDRTHRGLFAGRLSAALFVQYDVITEEVPWVYRVERVVIESGVTRFGGASVGMLFDVGFDLALTRGGEREVR